MLSYENNFILPDFEQRIQLLLVIICVKGLFLFLFSFLSFFLFDRPMCADRFTAKLFEVHATVVQFGIDLLQCEACIFVFVLPNCCISFVWLVLTGNLGKLVE